MGRAPALIAVAVLATGCGDTAPVAADAAIDADLIDFVLTGTELDWDSTAAAPCPVVGTKWWPNYDDSRIAFTDANGVFMLRIATYLVELDTDPQPASGACAGASPYTMPLKAIMPPTVYNAGGHFVARAMTAARQASLFTAIGAPFDPTLGQLLVHLDGPAHAVSISVSHAPEQAFDGTTWAAGATGTDVFFPNVDLSMLAQTTVTVDGGANGTGSVPLYAGTLFEMTVITN